MSWFLLGSFTEWNCIGTFHSKRGILRAIGRLQVRLGRSYFAPTSTQPSIPPGSVNEYQLSLGRQRQVWLTPIADERVGVQVKLWNPLRTRAIYLSDSALVTHYEEALYQVYASLPYASLTQFMTFVFSQLAGTYNYSECVTDDHQGNIFAIQSTKNANLTRSQNSRFFPISMADDFP